MRCMLRGDGTRGVTRDGLAGAQHSQLLIANTNDGTGISRRGTTFVTTTTRLERNIERQRGRYYLHGRPRSHLCVAKHFSFCPSASQSERGSETEQPTGQRSEQQVATHQPKNNATPRRDSLSIAKTEVRGVPRHHSRSRSPAVQSQAE